MRDLVIEKEKKEFYTFPEVNFDGTTGICKIEGESFMENAKQFYEPIMEWLEEFHEEDKSGKINLVLNYAYYNTSSSKAIYGMLFLMKKFEEAGREVVVDWHYNANDRELEDDIMDLQIETGLEINTIPEY